MSLTEDSPPFVDLSHSAENFKTAFDNDISSCLSALDSKISSLVCDPDSLGSSVDSRRKSNAHVEFSMAKLNVLTHIRNVFEDALDRWTDMLDAMRKEFYENVENFLSNTKLEVKLPEPPKLPEPAKLTTICRVVGNIKSTTGTRGNNKDNKLPAAVSSLYPKLLNTAKSIPGLSSLLPKNNEIEESSDEEEQPQPAPVVSPRPKTPKRVTISEQYVPSPSQNSSSRRQGNQYSANVSMVTNYDMNESEDGMEGEPVLVQTPVKRGRKSAVNTPASARKGKRSLKGGKTVKVVSDEPARRGRTPRKTPKKNEIGNHEAIYENAMEVSDEEPEETIASNKRTPKQVQFALGLDPNEDLEIYSPDLNISRSAPRRKTVVTRAVENFPDLNLTPEVVRAKSKRKTLAGSQLDHLVAPSPKRFKSGGGRNSIATPGDKNLLESEEEGNNSPWITIASVGPFVPAHPGVYELKAKAQAKKPAYIGSCENLQQKLAHHKRAEGTGHKHLDKFVERNGASLQVRYQLCTNVAEAEKEVFERVKKFMAQYKTTPAYN